MDENKPIILNRDCDAVLIPVGTPLNLPEGTSVLITQALGGSYTINVKDSDGSGVLGVSGTGNVITLYYDTSGNRDTLQKVTDIMMSEIAKLGDSLGADMSPVTHQETGKTPARAVS